MVLRGDGSSNMERAALGDGLGAAAAGWAVVDAVTRNAGVTLHGCYAGVTGDVGQTDVSFARAHASIYIGD